ncbi:phosphohistidine phosphatase SixA [Neoasaia chiangmaiensis NBRC 101099]|uniref:Uncharacterized protein n=1 Tax=Neoasaia chiangmaiensis TaxID=320497 RepID=A0A1U9KN77_9PROT|nr:histidine phosphatase family protein [Neoasaia chiangmaiensis]AQS87254.1 hypothetical protein A0U93_04075 [Neoasaia chiangmaiensis]GBR38466.1 phosphohistidine phosphatase SixA [Neoasaia chiangmaiensis NBRC 101099]GEN15884.1 phosphohistidine phosphatase [Neoasaia chiangmaiensis]
MKHHLLVLLRHAEAIPHAAAPDRQRVLTPFGRQQAAAAGKALAESGLDLSGLHVWYSPAERTRETAELARAALPPETSSISVDPLYDADLPRLMELLHETPDTVSALVVVGHNPVIAEACHALGSTQFEQPQFAALNDGYPPATLTAFRLTSDWAGLSVDTAELVFHHIG